MTGACRPTPPDCIARAVAPFVFDLYADEVAQAVWEALLAEGELSVRMKRDRTTILPVEHIEDQLTDEERVLVVPLVAGEDTTKEEHD